MLSGAFLGTTAAPGTSAFFKRRELRPSARLSDEDFVTVGFRLCSQVVVFQTLIDNGKRLLSHPDWKSLSDLVAPFFALTARLRDGIALTCFHEIRGYCPNIVGKVDVF